MNDDNNHKLMNINITFSARFDLSQSKEVLYKSSIEVLFKAPWSELEENILSKVLYQEIYNFNTPNFTATFMKCNIY